jgi:hypothetical protein
MSKVNLTIISITLFCTGSAYAAEDLSYTFIEGDYLALDIDAFDDDESVIEDIDDGNGWAIRGSVAFTDNFFAFADFSESDSDVTFVDDNDNLIIANQDVNRLHLGLGMNFPIFEGRAAQTDIVARAGYTDIDFGDFNLGASSSVDLGDLNDDNSDGFFIDAGLRMQLATWLEAGVGAKYTDIEDADDISFVGNLLFELNPAWGINVSADIGDEFTTYLAGLRFSFGAN